MKKYSAIILGLFLVACGATKVVTPTQTDVDRVSSKYPGYTLEQLNKGNELYAMHCAECHKLEKPTSETEEKWNKIVPNMVAKVNKKHPNTIDENSKELILKYVVTMSTAK